MNPHESQLPRTQKTHGTPGPKAASKKGIPDPREQKEIKKRIKTLEKELKL